MALPVGVSTFALRFGKVTDTVGELLSTTIDVAPSHEIVWAATGDRVSSVTVSSDAAEGVVGEVSLPHTDQAGFVNLAGDSITGWWYTVTSTDRKNGRLVSSSTRRVQVTSDVTVVDLDLVSTDGVVAPAGTVTPPLATPLVIDGIVDGLLQDDEAASTIRLKSTFGTPRPAGRDIVLLGDSFTAFNGGTSTATPVQSLGLFSSTGVWRWANIMLGQALNIIGNSGISGQDSAQVAARIQTNGLDLNPHILAIFAGTNDEATDSTWANLRGMYEVALMAGVFVVAFTIPPQVSGLVAAHRQAVNDEIRAYVAGRAGIVLVDIADIWQDHTVGGFVGRADYLLDGTHPGTKGAQVAGYEIARALAPILPPEVQPLPMSAAPFNMLTNGRFAGTGTSLASGWSASGSATYAYVAGPNGVGQRLAVTVAAGATVTLTQNVAVGALLAVSDEYDFTVTVEPFDLEVTPAATQRINIRTQNYTGAAFTDTRDAVYIDGGAQYGNARFPASRGVFRTQRGIFTSGKTLMQVVISLNGGGTYLLSDAVARNFTKLAAM